jgi:hypothetical protein
MNSKAEKINAPVHATKDNRHKPSFFGQNSYEPFFKSAIGFAQAQFIQPRCSECENEENQVNRNTEEVEQVHKREAGPEEEIEMTVTPTLATRDVIEQNTRHSANCEGVSVSGFTDANYGNSYTAPGTSSPGKSCADCSGEDCVTNTGTVVSVFTTNPQVTLPSVPSGLNECEQRAVRSFINTTLRAHEQQHVAAFNTYRGTVRTPYTYKGCSGGLDAYTQQIHDNIESARKAKSDAKSAALDANGANNFSVTCDCPDPEP